MRKERVDLLGGIALVAVSVALVLFSLVLFAMGRPGAPTGPEGQPGYAPAEITVFVPADVDVSVSVTYRPAGDGQGDQTVSVLPRGANRPSFLMLVELAGSAQLDRTNPPSGLFDRRPPQVVLPPVPSRLPGVLTGVESRQMFLVESDPELFLRTPQVSGNARIAGLQVDNSRSTLSTAAIVLEKCRNLPRTIADVSGADGVDIARLSRLTDYDAGADGCHPAEVDYRGDDRGTVNIAPYGASRASVRIDYAQPDPTKGPAASYSPTLDWTWVPHWTGPDAGAYGVRANFVDINQESQGSSMIFVSGALIGLAGGLAPAGVALLLRPWLARITRAADPGADDS